MSLFAKPSLPPSLPQSLNPYLKSTLDLNAKPTLLAVEHVAVVARFGRIRVVIAQEQEESPPEGAGLDRERVAGIGAEAPGPGATEEFDA